MMAVRWWAIGALATAAVVWDLRTRRVPNVLTIGAMVVALMSAGISGGADGLLSSALGWLTGLALFLPFFVVGGLGAGDVKLLAAFGAWLGPAGAVSAAFWAVLVGGALAVVTGLLHGYLGQAVRNLGTALVAWRLSGFSAIPGMTIRDNAGPRLAYAIPIAAGALVALWRAR